MRPVILVGLILHVVITVVESNYKFGDIISFPRKMALVSYKHFAVYVGPQANLFNQGEDKDIFHRIRRPIDGKYCVFGSLKNEPKHQIENYLDGTLNKTSDEDIIKHIKAMTDVNICGTYDLKTNNCEHLATYVRYGKAYLNQPETKAEFMCRLFGGEKLCPEADEAVKNVSNKEVQKILAELYKNSEIEDQDPAATAAATATATAAATAAAAAAAAATAAAG